MFTAADVPCDVVPGPVLQVAYLEERCLLCSGEVVLCPCVAEFVEEGGLGRTAHLDEVGLVVVGLVAAEGVAAAGSVCWEVDHEIGEGEAGLFELGQSSCRYLDF